MHESPKNLKRLIGQGSSYQYGDKLDVEIFNIPIFLDIY
jgi:hypothetical protein